MQPRRPHPHLSPSLTTTTWPISPAEPRPDHCLPSRMMPPPTPPALAPVFANPHGADLPGRAAAGPLLAVEDDAPADARAPEDSEDRLVGLAGAEHELGLRCDRDVVAEHHARAQAVLQAR